MRTITVLLAGILAATMFVGCSRSPQGQAAANLQEQADKARRVYLKAVSQMAEPTPQDENGVPSLAIENDQALAAMTEAGNTLAQALSQNSDATDIGRIPAQELQAEILQAIGAYHSTVAQAHIVNVMAQLSQAQQQMGGAELFAGLAKFFDQLAKVTPAELAAMKGDAQARQKELADQKAGLDKEQLDLKSQVSALSKDSEALSPQASDLRTKATSADGQEALELTKQVGQIERKINDNAAKINSAESRLEMIDNEVKTVAQPLALIQEQIKAIDARQAELAGRAGKVGEQKVAQQEMVKQYQAGLDKAAAQVVSEFALAVKAGELADASFQKAGSAAGQAITGLKARKNAARDMQDKNPDGGMAPVLMAMSGTGEECAANAKKGEIALASGDIRWALCSAATRIQAAAVRMGKAGEASGVPVPAAVTDAAKLVADPATVKSAATADYTAAVDAYEAAAKLPGNQPIDMRTRWMYQTQQARALLGLYHATADATHLAAAKRLVDENVLPKAENDSFADPVRQFSQMLAREK